MNNQAILITGANGGVARHTAEYLLRRGKRNLALQYRSSSVEIEQLLARYQLDPSRHLFKADLTNEAEVANLQQEVESKMGRVLTLINLAGSSTNGLSWKLSSAEFLGVMRNNVLTTFNTCKAFVPGMRDSNMGRIINTSSVVAFTGVAGAAHYCAAKAAVVGFSKALALELVNKQVTVNVIALGYFDTGLIADVPLDMQEHIKTKIPAKRFGAMNDVGSMIEFLASDEASYVTGQTFHLNGGLY